VEETVVLASVGSLQIKLPPAQLRAAEQRHSRNPEAYQAYLLGHHFASRRNTADLQKAIELFQSAVAKDPQYALAWAGLGEAYEILAFRGLIPPAAAFQSSAEAVDRALAVDPNLSEAWVARGRQRQWFWKWDEAEAALHRAVSLAPGLADAHYRLAGVLSDRGRHDEALRECEAALQLDPLSPSINNAYGAYLFRARRYGVAIERLEAVVRQQPAFINAKLILADVYQTVGRTHEAVTLAQAAVTATNAASFALADLGQDYGRAGERQKALDIASELEVRYVRGDAIASEIAQVYTGLGEVDRAIAWLEKGLATHDEEMPVLKSSPVYDGLRGDPRFAALLEKIGF
jgi:serine/threonine-protein kinase